MKPKIFIDGQEGTTGLQIHERLGSRDDITLLTIDASLRKDKQERKRLLNEADLVFLCLPDDAARESVSLIDNPNTRVIDASTAHRTAPGWVYGFPELNAGRRDEIRAAKRVANPGCHATGFIAGVYPLVSSGLLSPDTQLTCFSITGYSGGGKKMIASYEENSRSVALDSPRIYGLALQHKHLPEMTKVAALNRVPVFCPVVADYYKGMATTVMLSSDMLKGAPSAKAVRDMFAAYYAGQTLVHVAPFQGDGFLADGTIPSNQKAGTDSLELLICGNDTQIIVTTLFDNLGKGASGAAVQNMNLMLGFSETAGLLNETANERMD
jgi:N-acetyl-gamma-glutamyl-phosphate reductase